MEKQCGGGVGTDYSSVHSVTWYRTKQLQQALDQPPTFTFMEKKHFKR
uniref:Uncharacterized protein n=1 Tax=Anguilla anguilla TaxID=7936 RepID=A0A0E9PG54_ANGAN